MPLDQHLAGGTGLQSQERVVAIDHVHSQLVEKCFARTGGIAHFRIHLFDLYDR